MKTAINGIGTKNNSRFMVKKGNKYFLVKMSEIALIYIDNIVFLKLFNGDRYPLRYNSLNDIEDMLPSQVFFRASRQTIINLDAIKYLSQYKPGQFLINLIPPHDKMLVLSQQKSAELKNMLKSM